MTRLTTHRVHAAGVRPIGSAASYEPRSFGFMLDPSDPPLVQRGEAIRILRQLGYEFRGAIRIEEPSA